MHSSCNDDVIELSPLSSYVMLEVVETSHACFVHLVLQYFQLDLSPANLEAMRGVSFRAKTAFFNDVTLLRHHYVVSCKIFHFRSHGLSG